MKITQVGISGHSSDTTYHRELYFKITISHFHLSEVIQKVSYFGIAEVYSFQHFHKLQL